MGLDDINVTASASARYEGIYVGHQQHQTISGTAGGGGAPAPVLDIVIRDKNGEVELGDPPTPVIDDPDEVALDAQQESEKERQRLAEAVRQHQIGHNSVPAHPEGELLPSFRQLRCCYTRRCSRLTTNDFVLQITELLEAVRASLRAKVAALVEDNWMFEQEEPPRHQ